MESFGRYLKSEREARGVSIEEISRVTKISPGQLKALEADDLGALPTTTFVKGFIRAYAKHIGIEPDETMVRFENYLQEIEQEDSVSTEYVGTPSFRRDSPHLGLALVAGAVIGAIILILVLLARACGGSGEARRAAPVPTFTPRESFHVGDALHGETTASEDGRVEDKPLAVAVTLPMVPPDSFRVTRTGPPVPASLRTDNVIDAPANLGGGKSRGP